MQNKKSEIWVGVFMLLALGAMIFLSLRVADVQLPAVQSTWKLTATFDNIGGLKKQAPVKIGGVVIGRVSEISLDPETYLPRVTMAIEKQYNKIPDTSSLAIRTSGLLGEQYLALNLGFDDAELGSTMLKEGDSLQDTKSAIVLEDLIGQFLYKNDDTADKNSPKHSSPAVAPEKTNR